MAKYNLLISGPKTYRHYYQFARKLDAMIQRFPKNDLVILEDGDPGVGYLAYIYAMRRGIKCLTFDADWEGQGKAAGVLRNIDMLQTASHCVAFWDGKSAGTKHIVENVHQYPISYRAIEIPLEDKRHGKPKGRNGYCRKFNGRTVSKIRKRHHAARGFGKAL